MAVDQVVARTQSAIGEPGNITMGKTAGSNGSELLVPRYQVLRKLPPELGGIFDRFFVQGLIFVQTVDMRRGVMVLQLRMIEFLGIRCLKNNLFPPITLAIQKVPTRKMVFGVEKGTCCLFSTAMLHSL